MDWDVYLLESRLLTGSQTALMRSGEDKVYDYLDFTVDKSLENPHFGERRRVSSLPKPRCFSYLYFIEPKGSNLQTYNVASAP